MYVWNVNGTTCLGRRGTGRAAGPAEGWPHSCAAAAAGRTHKPLGRRCRREVCPGEEVCCPPSHPTMMRPSSCLRLCPQLKPSGLKNWTPATWRVLSEQQCDAGWHAVATKTKKTKKRRCAKMKLRPSPYANFVPGGATTPNIYQMSTLKTGMVWVGLVMVNLTPYPSSQLVLWYQHSSNLSSQRLVTQLELRKAFPFCLDCHKRRIMWWAAVAPLRTERLLKATVHGNKRPSAACSALQSLHTSTSQCTLVVMGGLHIMQTEECHSSY